MSRIRVALLGASGSIGLQAADVIAQHPDEFELVALASGRGGEQHDALAMSNPVKSVTIVWKLIKASRRPWEISG